MSDIVTTILFGSAIGAAVGLLIGVLVFVASEWRR